MELVEGRTLADVLAERPPSAPGLPVERALDAAHEHGIVHRHLEPGNIKLRDDGTVKVLDFGLAKALEQDGTAGYRAPEEARGRPVDKRADIWAVWLSGLGTIADFAVDAPRHRRQLRRARTPAWPAPFQVSVPSAHRDSGGCWTRRRASSSAARSESDSRHMSTSVWK